MKVKTADLIGHTLDWAVAKCEGKGVEFDDPRDPWLVVDGIADRPLRNYTPSNDWSQGGPLIEREGIEINVRSWSQSPGCDEWGARLCFVHQIECQQFGPTPLIAAMRCYVGSKVGDMLEIPEILM